MFCLVIVQLLMKLHIFISFRLLTDDWTVEISRSTENLYYFNRLKSESTFDVPKSEQLIQSASFKYSIFIV